MRKNQHLRRTLPISRLRDQRGVSLMIVLGFALLTGLIIAGAYAVTQADVHLSADVTAQKRAYYAAQYGVSSYLEHLLRNGNYLAYCTRPPEYEGREAENPLNNYYTSPSGTGLLKLAELHRVPVPGTSPGEEEYAIQLIPATSAPSGEKACNPANIFNTMIERTGPVKGSFRIKVTGFSKISPTRYETRSIVAAFRNEGFVSFVYYTQLETEDPAAYPTYNEYISGRLHSREEAEKECQQVFGVRPSWCEPIFFVTGDEVRGPMHTEDHVGVIGSPVFGREPGDPIEFRTAIKDACGNGGYDEGYSEEGWNGSTGCGSPIFKGQHIPPAQVKTLKPPPSDTELRRFAETEGYLFEGATEIILEGTSIRVKSPGTSGSGTVYPFPANGVIYVANSGGCAGFPYYGVTYPGETTCGNAFVRGFYTHSLTIATQNDIIIDGSLYTTQNSNREPIGNAVLGLVAEDFVRVYHPVLRFAGKPYCSFFRGCECSKETKYNASYNLCEYHNEARQCNAPSLEGNGNSENPNPLPGTEGSMREPVIDAAILALNHSFTVDNYQCPEGGPRVGTLFIRGAIAQRFRGVVATSWGNGEISGYYKNYEYDNRLLAEEPPHFLNPVQAAWQITRETLAPPPPE